MSLPLNQIVPKNYIFRKNKDTFGFIHEFMFEKVASLFNFNQLNACEPIDAINNYESFEIISLFDFNDTIRSGKDMVKYFIIGKKEYQYYKFYDFTSNNLNRYYYDENLICLPIFPKNDSAKFRIKMKVNGKEVETTTPTIYYN